MRRRTLLVLILGLALAELVACRSSLYAQEEDETPTPGPMATSQLVGSWLLDTNPHDPTNALAVATSTRDGNYLEAEADGTGGAGTWLATGPHTALLTFVIPQQNDKSQNAGFLRVRANIMVASDDMTFSAPYTPEVVDAAGKSTGQLGPGLAIAERITIEAPGTPVGPIPSGPPPGTPVAGTPAS